MLAVAPSLAYALQGRMTGGSDDLPISRSAAAACDGGLSLRKNLADLDGQAYDVLIIGGGINGAAAVQQIAAQGHKVLIVEKGDYGSGASSRSSRLLHCGLRYLAPGRSLWDFVRHPDRLVTSLRMARASMIARATFVSTTPTRARAMLFAFPIYKDGPYKGWQIDAAFRILAAIGPTDPPLDYRRVSAAEARDLPLVRELRDLDRLDSVALYREYEFDWPERLCIDCVLDAERMGATARNYTAARLDGRDDDGHWRATLTDALDGCTAHVRARLVLNLTGIWTDDVNAQAAPAPARRVLGTKGCHILLKLPQSYRGRGIATLNSKSEPFYCIPWHDLHFFGPTETVYESDKDDIRVDLDEQTWLVREANRMMPGIGITVDDIILTWAGVRPLTYDPAVPFGNRSRQVHDLTADGMPNVLAMTAGPITSYRSGGELLAKEVARRVPPSGTRHTPDFAAPVGPENDNAPFLVVGDRSVRLSDVQNAIVNEQAMTLTDILFRRTGLGWRHRFTREEIERAASVLAVERRLTPEQRLAAIAAFEEEDERLFGVRSPSERTGEHVVAFT